MKLLSLTLFLLMFFSCKNGKKEQSNGVVIGYDSLLIEDDKFADSNKENTVSLDSFIGSSGKPLIEIKTISKSLDTSSPYFDRSKAKCLEWNLSIENIKMILESSERIDAREFHYYYDVFPCYYTGSLIFNGKFASYEVNAGAFSVIEFKDTSITYGYKKGDYKSYFLLGPGIN